jgi:DNA-binding transcriptional regulator YiaG
MHSSGLLPDAAYDKITMRHMGKTAQAATTKLTGDEIKAILETARLSQAVFAHHLRLTVGLLQAGARRRASKRANAGLAGCDQAQGCKRSCNPDVHNALRSVSSATNNALIPARSNPRSAFIAFADWPKA